jgi:hypothetical protein
MHKKLLILFLLTFYTFTGFAQSEVDNYKYVVIPRTYEFLKIPDKHKLNSLTKFLFEKYGFTAYWQDDNFPADLIADPCLGLNADVINESNLFTSKLIVTLTNCSNNIVFTSEMGKSKEKDFKKSYHEALRRAFISVQLLDYHYTGKSSIPATKIVESAVRTPVVAPVAVPVVVEEKIVEKNETPESVENSIARSFKGENISFFLIAKDGGYTAYVNESKDLNFKKGEMIGTLLKTSLPNVYRINWKNKNGVFSDTTGYFDDNGNLKIDYKENGKITVKIFKVEN